LSVALHLVMPASRGLFASAIMESGNALAYPFAHSLATGAQFTAALNCTAAADVMACLRSRSTDEVPLCFSFRHFFLFNALFLLV
jgi:para-nitrobenzyl esterase